MKVRELVMLRHHKQFKDDYCLAKVDEDGLVRKVTFSYRKENPREDPSLVRLTVKAYPKACYEGFLAITARYPLFC